MSAAITEGSGRVPAQTHSIRPTARQAVIRAGHAVAANALVRAPAEHHGLAETTSTPDAASDGDHALVRRVQQGETAAFDPLVRKYRHRVLGLLTRHIADRSEREDVAQEAFLRAYQGLDRFRGESAFYTWLYRIVVNTARNHQVAAGRRPTARGADPADAEEFDSGALLRDGDTPEHNAAMDEAAQAIEAALAAMPEVLRQALVLRETRGMTYDEIAAAMDCPIGTVRSRIARARMMVDAFVHPAPAGPDDPGTTDRAAAAGPPPG